MNRKEQYQAVVGLLGEGPAAELVCRWTAPQRHEERIQTTLAVTEELPWGERLLLHALDLSGVGGRCDAEGVGTARPYPFNTLGNGEAYRAAALAAWGRLCQHQSVYVYPVSINTLSIRCGDNYWYVFLPDLYASNPELQRWVAAFAAKMVIAAAGEAPTGAEWLPPLVQYPEKDAAFRWAALYAAEQAALEDDPGLFYSLTAPSGARPLWGAEDERIEIERYRNLDSMDQRSIDLAVLGWLLRYKCQNPYCDCDGDDCPTNPGWEVAPSYISDIIQ